MINFKLPCIVIATLFISCASKNTESIYILDQKVVDRKLNISFKITDDFKCGSMGEYLVYLEKFAADSIDLDVNNIYKELDTLKIVNNKSVELSNYCYEIDEPRNVISFETIPGLELTDENAYKIMYVLDKGAEGLAEGMTVKRYSGKVKRTNKFPYLAAKYNVKDSLGNKATQIEIYYIQRTVDAIFVRSFINTEQTDFVEEIVRSITIL